jgi:hypothetical protein
MLNHLLNVFIAIPCSVLLTFAGAYCWVPAVTLRTTPGGTMIDIIPRKLRFWRALTLTGKVMVTTGCALFILATLLRTV